MSEKKKIHLSQICSGKSSFLQNELIDAMQKNDNIEIVYQKEMSDEDLKERFEGIINRKKKK